MIFAGSKQTGGVDPQMPEARHLQRWQPGSGSPSDPASRAVARGRGPAKHLLSHRRKIDSSSGPVRESGNSLPAPSQNLLKGTDPQRLTQLHHCAGVAMASTMASSAEKSSNPAIKLLCLPTANQKIHRSFQPSAQDHPAYPVAAMFVGRPVTGTSEAALR